MINEKRLLNEFIKLSKFDSESFQELEISKYIYNKLLSLVLEVRIDNAGHILNDNPLATGNIFGFLTGNKEGETIILSSHMDTVSPGKNKNPIIDGDIVRSDGNSVLGSDDLTGIAQILEILETITERNLRHPDIEVIFFIAEEPYCRGSSQFDFSNVKGKIAYVLDLDGKVGNVAISAPSIIQFKINIIGKASHAGFEPEKGISAIKIISNVISKLNLGRIDEETTLNIGLINGGTGINIIPKDVSIEGEIRSMNQTKVDKLLVEIENIVKEETNKYKAKYEFRYEEKIKAYHINKDEYVIKRYNEALNSLGYDNAKLINTFGGSDNNSFNKNGIKGIVIANAMNDVHTTHEYFSIKELNKSAKILLKLVTI